MRLKLSMILMVCFIIISIKVMGVYIEKFPQSITQPNGSVINCFISGDEFFIRLHDKDNYTIIRNPKTGYYCYAIYQNDKILASNYIVGIDNPILTGIQPGIQRLSEQIEYLNYKSNMNLSESSFFESNNLMESERTLNNIVIYISFSDQSEFGAKQEDYSTYFNSTIVGANSMYNYFREASYQTLNIISSFYPINDGWQIISYKDPYSRNYYCPWTTENVIGYITTDNDVMRKERVNALIVNAVNSVKDIIPSSLNIDSNNDGKVDNICFVIRGMISNPIVPVNYILVPHAGKFPAIYNLSINSKAVWNYNFQIENYLDYLQTGVLCHEMFHSIGGGDLYHYIHKELNPVGKWDLMGTTANPPQSMCADYKKRYGRWIPSIPEITVSGHYTLNPITIASNNCYKLKSTQSDYFVLEFRQKTGTFESSIPGTGLIIYRVHVTHNYNNANGPPDYIYVYRPDGTNTEDGSILNAFFDTSVGRSAFHNYTNPNCFLTDGSLGNIFIKNIIVLGNTVSFDVRFCDATDILYSSDTPLPPFTNAINQIKTVGSVLIKNTDNITFEAGNEILLNSGFEVQLGGQFVINMNSCGNQ